MKKKLIWIVPVLMVILLLFSAKVWAAKPDFLVVEVANPVTGEPKKTVTVPAKAVEVAPNLFYLGTAEDKGRIVEGYAIIDYKKGFGKPGTECGNGICEPGENPKRCPADCAGGEESDTSSCYGFLAKGAKWRTIEPYMVDPTNSRNLDPSFVRSNIALDISKWEDAADGKVDGKIKEILGEEMAGVVNGADLDQPDNKNEVYFADVDYSGAIAMTVVWGIFSGPPWVRELVEWDQVYDQVDFDWSSSGEVSKMDFENIATHELGHSVGLGDLYEDKCSEQTMYGFADYGETKKRDLESGDITGVREHYQ